jgi:hypothetical protein
MEFKKWADSKMRKMDWTDMALVKLACITSGVLIASLVPSLLGIDAVWIAALALLLTLKPIVKVLA